MIFLLIPVDLYLSAAEDLATKPLTYRLGGSGTDGTCDCIGLIIGAYELCGETWPGDHGSNYTARYAVTDLSPITSAGDLFPGMFVFKARLKGETNYSLPERYARHPDQLDYYHVGVVISVSPLLILHMSSPGICRDTKLGKWKYSACLKYLDYSGNNLHQKGSDPAMSERTVTAASGSTVNLRKSASTSSSLITRVPIGNSVTVLNDSGTWSKVMYQGKTGYIRNDFLTTASASDAPESETLESRVAALEARVSRLEEGVG